VLLQLVRIESRKEWMLQGLASRDSLVGIIDQEL